MHHLCNRQHLPLPSKLGLTSRSAECRWRYTIHQPSHGGGPVSHTAKTATAKTAAATTVPAQPSGLFRFPAPTTASSLTSCSMCAGSSGCPHSQTPTSEYLTSPQLGQRPQQSQYGTSQVSHTSILAAKRIFPQAKQRPQPAHAARATSTTAWHPPHRTITESLIHTSHLTQVTVSASSPATRPASAGTPNNQTLLRFPRPAAVSRGHRPAVHRTNPSTGRSRVQIPRAPRASRRSARHADDRIAVSAECTGPWPDTERENFHSKISVSQTGKSSAS